MQIGCCQLATQESKVLSFYRKTATQYDKEYENPYFLEVYDKITWHYIKPYLPKTGIILDAGGGTGKWSVPIAKEGLKVILCDLSKDMLKVAEQKIKQEELQDSIFLIQADISHIPFLNSSFKFALAEGDPISYCSNPKSAVRELSRVLKQNCFIAAGVDSLFATLRRMLNSEQFNPDEVLKAFKERRIYARDWGFQFWMFTPKDLRRLFTKNKLRIIKIAGKPIMLQRRPETDSTFQDKEKTRKLLEIELKFCDNPEIVGYGGHLHVVAQKDSPKENRKR
jgi:ubiquinone/menaquinone biosynthesis C-methylase UbiE